MESPASRRLARVLASGLLDSPPQREFDEIVMLAAELTDCPISLVTILDDKRQWFKAAFGTSLEQTPIEWSFCTHAIESKWEPMVVEDALKDARVCASPLVTDQPGIRAYLGIPLCSEDGEAFGTLCAIDLQSRTFSDQQQRSLQRLAVLAEHLINSAIRSAESISNSRAESEIEAQRLVMMLTYGIDIKAYIDADGCYEYVNKAFLDKFGLTEDAVVGKHISAIVGEMVYRTEIQSKFELALGGHEVQYLRLVNYPVVGQRWMEASLFPIQGNDGRVRGVVLRARDVHELVLANQALIDQGIRQEQFIAVLAHDVREPIRTVKSFIGLVIEEVEGRVSSESIAYLKTASRGADRLSMLVSSLLGYLKADGQKIPMEAASLGAVFDDVLEDLQCLIATTGASVVGRLNAEVQGNHVWLRICLQNLVTNAIKFTHPGVRPDISVACEVTCREVLVRVKDNGIGIAAAHFETIFDPFTRLATPTGVDGAGLGLSLCRRIATLHGGSLCVESSDHAGSVFILRLPKVQKSS